MASKALAIFSDEIRSLTLRFGSVRFGEAPFMTPLRDIRPKSFGTPPRQPRPRGVENALHA